MGTGLDCGAAGRNGQGKVSRRAGLGLDSMDDFVRLWASGAVASCLIPDPGVSKPRVCINADAFYCSLWCLFSLQCTLFC